MSQMSLFTGTIIKSYEVKERIGAGGFGEVYRAVQATVDREVAVKIILPEYANQPEFIRRFETEAQLVARLEHPHIVPLYDYWRDPSGAYLIMRYLRGGSLRDSIEEHGAWSTPRVAQMLNQIASALSFAHASGVVHRDLKTDNILIDEAGNAYLTDFGIAKDLGGNENLTQDAILGTPAYLSPEQIRGEAASPHSDIYALGILIFETLTGHKPFFDHTPATVLFKQLNEPLPAVQEYRDDLPADLDVILARATDKDATMRYDTALAFARDFISVVRESAPGIPASGTMTLDVMSITEAEQQVIAAQNPYKGLRAFQQADADDFFGRDQLVQDLIAHLAITGKNRDFLSVVGPSGSGKSSVVKAGVLPRIREGVLDSELDWYTAEMVPGTHPMEELEAALLAIATAEMPGLMEQLAQDERGLVRAVKRILPQDGQLVLFIDQFEETFTLISDEDERSHFMQSILNAVEDERSRIKIIITLRADFYDRPLLYAQFGNLIRQNTELALPLNEQELEKAVRGPAERIGLALETALTNAIISDVAQQPGALPLLQYALTELFERRNGRLLTLAAYQDIGGITGALARRAEELYQSFDSVEQAATRQMFLRLVTLGEGTEDTRRRVMQAELLSLGQQSVAMRQVIDRFGKYRLLTFDHDPRTRSSTVEVAHEALIRQWQRVRDWLEENREALRLHRRLTQNADEWNSTRRDPSFLARGMRLQQFEEWSVSSDIIMNQVEKAFLETSIQAREEREAAERAQAEREEELQRRARRFLTVIAVGGVIAAVVLGIAAFFAINAQGIAEEQAIIAERNAATATVAQGLAVMEANRAATAAAIAAENEQEARALALAANARNAIASGDPVLALSLAVAAEEIASTSEVVRTLADIAYAPGLRYRYGNHSGSVLGVAFSEDGRYGVSASVDGTVRVWDHTSGDQELSLTIPGIWFNDAAISTISNRIVAAGSDGNVYIWDLDSGAPLQILNGHSGEVMSVEFSPDASHILTGGADYTARLWNATTGEQQRIFEGHTGVIYKAIFSADGTRIATGAGDESPQDNPLDEEDRTVRIWDRDTGELINLIDPESGFVRSLDFSPDGQNIAYGVWDSSFSGTVRIADVQTGEELERFFAHTTPVLEIAYFSDGRYLLSASWDNNVRIWDLQRRIDVQNFTGFGDRILTADISPADDYLMLGLGNIGDNEFTTDRATDPAVLLWDIRSRDQIYAYNEMNTPEDWFWTVDVSADGQLAAAAGGPFRLPELGGENYVPPDTTVRVFDVESGETVAAMRGHSNTVDSVAFHPDGQHLLSASWDRLIILWNIEEQDNVRLYRGHEDHVYMVQFTADGSQFISVSADGRAILWDTDTATIMREYTHPAPVNAVDISPDGTRMLTTTGGNDNNIYLWDIATGRVLQAFSGHTSEVNEARFHPSGEAFVSTSWDNTVRAWDIETGREIRRFSGHTGNTFGAAFSSDGELLITTSQDTSVRLWNWETGEELRRFNEHNNWVLEVTFTPDDNRAISAGEDPAIRVWRIDRSAQAIEDYIEQYRHLELLSCDERLSYGLEVCTGESGSAE